VLRGLHFQETPAEQDKLVRVSRGAIFDVAVDIRRNSPTFGQWDGAILSADEWNQMLVPKGFAHGFVTLEENTEVQYKVSAPYRADLDRAIRYDDPAIGIDWPEVGVPLTLSDKDRRAPLLSEIRSI
jgi:dTDP-4-dehydrorhamnose 3,5-epimerase